ncbi:MAG: response regulator [Deltaproteobacteria bacterium]|nr:response regulator [Deltaproteobacteria bacterium]
MAQDSFRLLLIEDNPGDARLFREMLADVSGVRFHLEWAETLSSGLARLERTPPDLLLLDLSLPDCRGIETFRRASAWAQDVPIVVLTGLDDQRVALEAVRGGAQDYFLKGEVEAGLLARAIRYAVERKAAERSLRESQQLAQATLDALAAHIAIVEADGTILSVNSRWTDFAYANGLPSSLVGENYLAVCDRVRGEGAAAAAEAAAGIRRVASGAAEDFELEYTCHAPETRRWFGMRVTRFPGSGPVRLAVAHSDVTTRRLAEERNRLLATAVERAAEAIVVTDAAGAIEYANPAFESITGYSAAEAEGQNPRFLKSGRQDDAFYREMWAALTAGDVWRGRLTNRRKDGALYEEECTISPVAEEDAPIRHFVAVKRDVTQEAKLEAQLRQAQKMEAVGRLAGGVAHDFNNLLQVIFGATGLLLEDRQPGGDDEKWLLQVQKAAERAAGLTGQLLAFSRKQVVEPRVLDLNAVVLDTEKMLRRLIGEDVELTVSLSPDLRPVRIDPGQVEQILLNLAVNARDAMPEGGSLAIETALVELGEDYVALREGARPGPHVLLAVSDAGCGMDRDTLSHIFEPFFTTKERGHGTGLGLATVYGIVKQAGGHIWAYSEPGRGSAFKIYLPPAEGAAEALRARDTAAAAPRGTETVLVVEDEAPVRALVRKILSGLGYTVLEAPGPDDALSAADDHAGPLHLLLTDVVMPGMGGPKLAEAVTATRPGVKVLYMSGYLDDAIVRHGVLERGTRFLQKPFTTLALARKVREVLDEGGGAEGEDPAEGEGA